MYASSLHTVNYPLHYNPYHEATQLHAFTPVTERESLACVEDLQQGSLGVGGSDDLSVVMASVTPQCGNAGVHAASRGSLTVRCNVTP